MKAKTKHALFLAWAWCDHEDKSTEFMLAYMADFAGVSYERAVDFVTETSEKERTAWYKANPDWLENMNKPDKVQLVPALIQMQTNSLEIATTVVEIMSQSDIIEPVVMNNELYAAYLRPVEDTGDTMTVKLHAIPVGVPYTFIDNEEHMNNMQLLGMRCVQGVVYTVFKDLN